MLARSLIGVAAFAMTVPAIPAHAQSVTLCGQNVDYQPVKSDTAKSADLIGVWVGEVLGLNVRYNSDYRRCYAFAIERITPDGKVVAKHAWGDAAITPNGNKWSVKPVVHAWSGVLSGNNTLRFEGNEGSLYELQTSGPNRMEGRFTHSSGSGRIFLKKQ